MFFHSIDGWEDQLYQDAIKFLTKGGMLKFDENSSQLLLSEQHKDLAEKEDITDSKIRWITWCVAVEMLLKSVLLKFHPETVIQKQKCPNLQQPSSKIASLWVKQKYWKGVCKLTGSDNDKKINILKQKVCHLII